MAHRKYKFVIRFVDQFSDRDIMTEATKALSLRKNASTVLMSSANKYPAQGGSTYREFVINMIKVYTGTVLSCS